MLTYHLMDVFTDTAFAGNPLAVVLGADGLTSDQMQTIAREFNLSETIFVMAPQDPGHSARVRIFFPTAEIPFAGHPTIGCAIHLATAAQDGDFATTLTLEEEAGLVPVRVTRIGDRVLAELTAPLIPHAAPEQPEPDTIAAALGIMPSDLGPHRPRNLQGGPRFLFAQMQNPDVLARLRPTEPHWSDLMHAMGVDSLYAYARGMDCDYRARMFSPTAGIPEDPATGSATAILAAQLLAEHALAEGTTTLVLHQGYEMGRPSQLGLSIDMRGGRLTAVRISGSAVAIGQGRIARP